jgi:hypothetical protein
MPLLTEALVNGRSKTPAALNSGCAAITGSEQQTEWW